MKISDELHDEIREASAVMSRSINAQAEFWIKVGRLAEENPTMTFTEIIAAERLRVKSLEQKRTEYAAGNDQNSQ